MPPSRLSSEVTGTLWKIEVNVGDAVVVDQTLVVFESMKMEIPLTAPHAGVVRELLVSEGESVADGQDILVIE